MVNEEELMKRVEKLLGVSVKNKTFLETIKLLCDEIDSLEDFYSRIPCNWDVDVE